MFLLLLVAHIFNEPSYYTERKEVKSLIEKWKLNEVYKDSYEYFEYIENNVDTLVKEEHIGDKMPLKMHKRELDGSIYHYSLINWFLDTEHFIIYDNEINPVVEDLCDVSVHKLLTCYCLKENKRWCEIFINH